MSKQDSNTNGRGRRGPPPVPEIPQKRFQTASFRGAAVHRPSNPPGRPEGVEPRIPGLPQVPKDARTTKSLAIPVPREVREVLSRGEDTLTGIISSSEHRGHTLAPARSSALPDEKENAIENEERFLRYGSALYRVSEIAGEDWKGWIAEPALLREKVAIALETLKGKRLEDEKYASEYQMARAFSKEIANDAKLDAYLCWVHGKETEFARMANAYGDMRMTPLTPYLEVMEACEKLASGGVWGEPNKGIILFNQLIVNAEEYGGSVYSKGEWYRRMFDAWYLHTASASMGKVYDLSGISAERDAALIRVGEILNDVRGLKEENRRLAEEAGKRGVPSAVMEEVHGLRGRTLVLEAENGDLRIALAKERETVSGLREVNIALGGAAAEKDAEILTLRGELSRSEEANMGLMERIRELVAKVDAYDKRTEEMEGRLAIMERQLEKLQDEKADLARQLTLTNEPDFVQRPTMVSGTFEVPAEIRAEAPAVPGVRAAEDSSIMDLKALTGAVAPAAPRPAPGEAMLAGIDEEVGDALEAGFAAAVADEEPIVVQGSGSGRRDRSDREVATQVSLVPEAEAARMIRVEEAITAEPREMAVPEGVPEITQPIDIEEEGREFEFAAQRKAGFWGKKPGKAIHAIFAYGFAGKGELPSKPVSKSIELPPISEADAYEKAKGERELESSRFMKGMREYHAWYNVAGRWIHGVREETISAAHAVSDFYSRKKRQVQIAATGVVGVGLIAAVTAVGYGHLSQYEREQEAKALQISKPVATQVASPDVDTGGAENGKAGAGTREVAPAPEPLAKPLLADVLSKHGLELGEGTHIVTFYKGLGGVTDVQERYVILAEALKSDELLQKYEKKYIEGPVLEMYTDFLKTAMAYAGLGGQTDAERAGAKALGETVAKRLDQRVQQKRIKEKIGNDRASEMREIAGRFNEFSATLPVLATVENEKQIEIPVVTSAQLEEMKKAGEAPETGVILLPDKAGDKPFDMGAEMQKVVGPEFQSLDTPAKVNEFGAKAEKADGLADKFLMQAHLTGEIVEHDLGSKMSEKRVLSMHLDTMNSAVRFAMEEGQGMTAVAEAMNVFDVADGEVKRLIKYKGMQKEISAKRQENISWLRNRAEELKGKAAAYERNKGVAVPLPGSPALDNANGAPTAMPEKVKLDRYNESVAMQTLVFSEHGLSILEHPLKVYEQMKRMKINNFDRFIILDNLVGKVMGNPVWMDGLSKAEQFEMLKMLASYLRAAKMAANEPKNWRDGYTKEDILLNSLTLEVSEIIGELRKLEKATPKERTKHLHFQMDQETYNDLGKAAKEFGEALDYEYKQKGNMWE